MGLVDCYFGRHLCGNTPCWRLSRTYLVFIDLGFHGIACRRACLRRPCYCRCVDLILEVGHAPILAQMQHFKLLRHAFRLIYPTGLWLLRLCAHSALVRLLPYLLLERAVLKVGNKRCFRLKHTLSKFVVLRQISKSINLRGVDQVFSHVMLLLL